MIYIANSPAGLNQKMVSRLVAALLLFTPVIAFGGEPSLKVTAADVGIMGTGSNPFRTGLVHSSGTVFLGTYGPQPAIVWKYDPTTQKLTKVGAPGEYQLDSMVEAPNGKIYIGTAYNALVYELDPKTNEIRNLGSPPVDSTPWIFTMIRTRDGEIYGAKGVGIFHLDWRTGKMESCGIVPGNHHTGGDNPSMPIVRELAERPDGVLWGDTNRWIFTFDPRTRKIKLLADIFKFDESVFCVPHPSGVSPISDLFFTVFARFGSGEPKYPLAVCSALTGKVSAVDVEGLELKGGWPSWWVDGGKPKLLVSQCVKDGSQPCKINVVDIDQRKVVDRWTVEGHDFMPNRIAGPGLWFVSMGRGTLYEADPNRRLLVARAVNPVPAECRCLAASPTGLLGADTYDCGFVFTMNPTNRKQTSHGKVWFDEHRCNYGPAAFAGETGRYFLANHGEAVAALWVTDIETNEHLRIGDSAVQLLRFRDGTVWGVQGPSLPSYAFSLDKSWTPARHTSRGKLFRYTPGAKRVEILAEAGEVGPLTEAPTAKNALFFGTGKVIRLYDSSARKIVWQHTLPAEIVAASTDYARSLAYFVLSDGTVWRCKGSDKSNTSAEKRASGFGKVDRGCFVLPVSGRLVGIASNGMVSVYDPETDRVEQIEATVPQPSGPAVDPRNDAWFFAERSVVRYDLRR